MVRFSDIGRGKDESKEEATPPEIRTSASEDVGAVYSDALTQVKQIYQRVNQKKELNIEDVYVLVKRLLRNITLTNDKIIFLTSNPYSIEDYLFYHSLNVSILAIRIGLHLDYSEEHLLDLGTLAILHAIDSQEGEGYTLQELEKQEFIQRFIKTRHPQEKFIKEALSIIAVTDVYESLTHTRQYRQRFKPYDVLRAIISTAGEVFNPAIIKKILEAFSLYPLGSFVRLNTEEVAQVVRINEGSPLRPQVVIITDNQGKKLSEKKTVDLSAHLNLYIKEPVLEEISS